MALDKRHPMSTDMNDIDVNDAKVLTDQEREKMQMATDDIDKKMHKPKQNK